MEDSDSDSGSHRSRSRSRSRSPRPSRRRDDSSDEEPLTASERKIEKVVRRVFKTELASIKKSLYKTEDTTGQVKGNVDHLKRGMTDIKLAAANIEAELRKNRKRNPRESMSKPAITAMNKSIFDNLKKGKGKDELISVAFQELLDKSLLEPSDEENFKPVAKREFSHLKSELRTLVSTDLAVGNYSNFPKAAQYLRSHLKIDTNTEDTLEYLTIIGLGLARYENLKEVPLSEVDERNRKRIHKHVDNFWDWCKLKFSAHKSRGETYGEKLGSIIVNIGYLKRESEGAVRQNPDA